MDYASRLDAEETTRRYINSRKYESTYSNPTSSSYRYTSRSPILIIWMTELTLSLDDFRIRLKIIRNSNKNVDFEVEFEL